MTVRVRFAPSPTGHLHIGGARTALFNWLFARQKGGTFLLRIEDTDEKRSSGPMVEGILEGLRWLGIDWDEGPYFQSERVDLYQSLVDQLIRDSSAYRDFSSAEELGGTPRSYRDLPAAESERRAKAGEPFAVRFKVPEDQRVAFLDQVFGRVVVDSSNIEDFVILRSDGFPTYHLSVVADDLDMRISHVIRGADHLSNTSKHVLLYQALGAPLPVFAHLPLILGPDRKRLSKRHGATSVTEYSRMGLLPSAVRNYLALLGWSPGDDSELLNDDELIERFDLSRVNKADAVFDISKLEWMNKRYLSSAGASELEPLLQPLLRERGLWQASWESSCHDWLLSVIDLLKTRVGNLLDFPVYGRAFFTDEFDYAEDAVERYLNPTRPDERKCLIQALEDLRAEFTDLSEFNLETTEEVLRRVAESRGVKAGRLIGAVRVAATGRAQAPGLFEVLVTLGQQKTVQRLARAIETLIHG